MNREVSARAHSICVFTNKTTHTYGMETYWTSIPPRPRQISAFSQMRNAFTRNGQLLCRLFSVPIPSKCVSRMRNAFTSYGHCAGCFSVLSIPNKCILTLVKTHMLGMGSVFSSLLSCSYLVNRIGQYFKALFAALGPNIKLAALKFGHETAA